MIARPDNPFHPVGTGFIDVDNIFAPKVKGPLYAYNHTSNSNFNRGHGMGRWIRDNVNLQNTGANIGNALNTSPGLAALYGGLLGAVPTALGSMTIRRIFQGPESPWLTKGLRDGLLGGAIGAIGAGGYSVDQTLGKRASLMPRDNNNLTSAVMGDQTASYAQKNQALSMLSKATSQDTAQILRQLLTMGTTAGITLFIIRMLTGKLGVMQSIAGSLIGAYVGSQSMQPRPQFTPSGLPLQHINIYS